MSLARPLYFPVKAEPLRMQAGLSRFGTDFGNGASDRLFFPRDETSPRYLAEKTRVLREHPGRNAFAVENEAGQRCLGAAEAWLHETLRSEGHEAISQLALAELGEQLVEDFAIMQCSGSGADRALFVHACFPSGWRPEHVVGKSFAEIHARIPAFDAIARKGPSLVEAMATRGPYVRFVWTIAADDELDHHPDQGRKSAWTPETARGFLRVERQTTVPLLAGAASVFLIRTYLYGFDELSREQRVTLASALRQLAPEIVHYKRLETALPRALELLA